MKMRGPAPTFNKLHVWIRVAENILAVAIAIFASNLQLFRGHVNAYDRTVLPNQSCSGIAISTRSTAKVQDTKTFYTQRQRRPAPIKLFHDHRRNALDNVLYNGMRPSRCGACTCL